MSTKKTSPQFGVTADLDPSTFPALFEDENADITQRIGNPVPVSADIVLPVFNEEERLDSHVRTLMSFLTEHETQRADFSWNIVIADKASTDSTWNIATELTQEFPSKIRALRIAEKGHGRALKLAWGESLAQVVSYMDIGLSTDIKDVGFLIGSLLVGGADIAIGSRLLSESQVERSFKRDFISRTYNLMLRSYLDASFHDAQCGFKAVTANAAHTLLPLVCSDGLFFDTELLLLAQNAGMLIYEIPVVWTESVDKDFSISDTIQRDLEGMRRMKRTFSKGVTQSGIALPWNRDGVNGKASKKNKTAVDSSQSQSSSARNDQAAAGSGSTTGTSGAAGSSTDTSGVFYNYSDAQAQSRQWNIASVYGGYDGPADVPLSSVGTLSPRTTLIDVATVRFSQR